MPIVVLPYSIKETIVLIFKLPKYKTVLLVKDLFGHLRRLSAYSESLVKLLQSAVYCVRLHLWNST